ncbi:MAG: hypothetical protein MMC33_004963 [Icmadophila ericetorum]|nr:hypothetical protein [Icmadophila ericetorum]
MGSEYRVTADGTVLMAFKEMGEYIGAENRVAKDGLDWGFGLRRGITFPLFGDGIFTQGGRDWKHSRELLRLQSTYKQYENLDIFRDHVNNLLLCMSDAEGKAVDLQPLYFRLTSDTTTAFLFGESIFSLKAGDREEKFEAAFNTAQRYVAKRSRLLDLYWLIGGKEFDNACKDMHNFADEILDRSLNPTDETKIRDSRYIFLDANVKDSPNRMALRHQMMNILVAGRDTTACLLSWTLFLLVRHPRVLDKLRNEIAASIASEENIHRTQLKSLAYLNNVIKETLRLYPSVPVNQKTSLKTTVFPTGGGPDWHSPVLIPRGTSCAYSVYSLHRRKDLYGEDAEGFRPERWEEDLGLYRDEVTRTWGYLPFNGEPRVCLGMDFALTEAAYTIVRIIHRFPITKLPPDEPVVKTGKGKQIITLVISIGDGCNVVLE